MTWRPKTFVESLFPFGTLYAIVGLGVFQYPIGHRRVLFSVVYGITVTIIYWVSFGMTVIVAYEHPKFDGAGFLLAYILYFHFVIALLAQFIILYNGKKFMHFVERMTSVDRTLSELGATFDYTKCTIFCIMIIIYWLIMTCCLNLMDVLWFYDQFSVGEIILNAFILHHPVHTNTLVSLSFGLMIRLIEQRLGAANKLLKDKFTIVDRYFVNNDSSIFSTDKITKIHLNTSIRSTVRVNDDRKFFVQTIKHIHLELTLIARDTNEIYGPVIILEIAAEFVMFTGLLYTLYDMAIKPYIDKRSLRSIVLLTWLAMYFSKMFITNYSCERIMREAKRTGSLICCFNDITKDSEFFDEIRQFSLQLKNNPLLLTTSGFFTLGYKFFKGFIISVVTYLMIMIQVNLDPDIYDTDPASTPIQDLEN